MWILIKLLRQMPADLDLQCFQQKKEAKSRTIIYRTSIYFILIGTFKVVRDPCQKITLLLLKSKSVRVIVPESCF